MMMKTNTAGDCVLVYKGRADQGGHVCSGCDSVLSVNLALVSFFPLEIQPLIPSSFFAIVFFISRVQ